MHVPSSPQAQLQNRLDIHDRKQFELKLEYTPSGRDPKSKYLVDMFMFVPASLNVDAETYPRQDFYADIHNYIRFKTPVMNLEDLLSSEQSPLVRLEGQLATGHLSSQSEIVYDAKLLSCAFRGALRRFLQHVDSEADALSDGDSAIDHEKSLLEAAKETTAGSIALLKRFRALTQKLQAWPEIEEKTRAAFRLVDEYMSLSVEQFLRKAAADMDELPRTGVYVELRKELMGEVIREESYRRENKLRSILNPAGENEEYMQRLGLLKKYCMNILFLAARRQQARKGWEEVLFAIAAGFAMAFATAVAFWAQARFPQISLNFFLIVVVGYMMKDRIKEGLRKIFSNYAAKHLFDRAIVITDPVTKNTVGVCKEKVDYGHAVPVPAELLKLRQTDDIITVSQGELAECVIRYQKQITLNTEELPRITQSTTGVTDIIRINVERLLRDMDDPDHPLEYVDIEQLSVGWVKAAKAYQIDLAFCFTVDDADQKRTSFQLVRLVLDRNGIKRMHRFEPSAAGAGPSPVRSVA